MIPQGGVEGLGPWGPVAFVLVVMLCEMVPLFPTQPLSLASGLLFGAINVSGRKGKGCTAPPVPPGANHASRQKLCSWRMLRSCTCAWQIDFSSEPCRPVMDPLKPWALGFSSSKGIAGISLHCILIASYTWRN
eukprot:1144499-Pelagomonas_calceolata.AAC.4